MKFNKWIHLIFKNSENRRRLFQFFTWVFMSVSVFYLAYKLINFDGYSDFRHEWESMNFNQFVWLIFAILLLPINWLSESVKWKIIVSDIQTLSLKVSLKSVLAGYSTGFFSPNRTGDVIGRLIFLNSSNRKTGILLSFLSSITQNMAIAICGIPASFIFFTNKHNDFQFPSVNYLIIISIVLVLLILFFFIIPPLATRIKNVTINQYVKGFRNFSYSKFLLILVVSFIRFVIFSVQFYAVLQFFGVNLSLVNALVAIPANYLFVTFTPSLAFSEPLIRGSFAVFFIGNYSSHIAGIALAGIFLWIINYVVSMVTGYIILLKKAHQ